MTVFYELAVLGVPSTEQVAELEKLVSKAVAPFGMRLGQEVAWEVGPDLFEPERGKTAAAVFYGGKDASPETLRSLMRNNIPVLPVASDHAKVKEEIPEALQPLNCLAYSDGGAQRVATALLECAGLLPQQRRVFVSYRRNEARQAALQLFEMLSSKVYDVFLDTHDIPPSDDFQARLWHRLCDSDVVVMLDTPDYFGSRWTDAEFGRALAKGISILRIGWPGVTPSPRAAMATPFDLSEGELDPGTGQLSDDVVARICTRLEALRSQSIAVRNSNLVSDLRNAIEKIGGSVTGVGMNKAVHIQLADSRNVVVYPTVGVPTSTTLHDATSNSPDRSVAVVFDHLGVHSEWLKHLDWLGSQVRSVRWVKVREADWRFADWEEK